MANFTLQFSGIPTSLVPTNSTRRALSVRKLIDLLLMLTHGRFKGTVGVAARNSAVAASGTVTVSGAVSAADTVTVNGQALTAQVSYAHGTVTFASLAAADTVTVGTVTFTARASPTLATEFGLGASDTEAAANLVAKINTNATTSALVFAGSAAGVVTVRNLVAGTAGNHAGASAVTLTSSNGTRAAVTNTSSSKLDGASAVANNTFDIGVSPSDAGDQLVAAIAASTTSLVSGHVTAANASGVVTITSKFPGVSGNAITLAKSGSNLAVSGARLTAGSDGTLVNFVF